MRLVATISAQLGEFGKIATMCSAELGSEWMCMNSKRAAMFSVQVATFSTQLGKLGKIAAMCSA